VGNPRAFDQNVRFLEADLNRMFDDAHLSSAEERVWWEYKTAQRLKPLIEEADIVLDLHASTSVDSVPFAICEAPAQALAQGLPVAYMVGGFDRVQPGGTDWYAGQVGRLGICVECGYLGDPQTTPYAETVAKALLASLGMLDESDAPAKVSPQPRTLEVTEQYLTTDNFTPSAPLPDFTLVQAGTLLGWDGGKPITASGAGYVLFLRGCDGAGQEAFLIAPSVSHKGG